MDEGTLPPGASEGPAPVREGPGTIIGRYKLLELLGEGGFGVVFLAEQREPVQRRVALKVLKLGMDTRQVIARFEAERQALALMDHPHIAAVFDAGATDTGRPYFVMELVKGDPITEYCDKNNVDLRQRLELFQQVCHAVQHAHQKGIIHRDLKPYNVLVAMADGRPIPKVIDFGIAKATAGRLTDKTLFTEHRAFIGTPEYMSPEQAEMSGVDIDTRSDVYSLGVVLYELLTGTTPFEPRELRSAAFDEIQRIIREVEPPKPSTRLSTRTDTLAAVAARRHTEPARLRGLIRGDLDWIVMRCLEKDRTRRYETASELALDVRRHLAGEPVLAAPPSTAYRLRKLVRRNRGPVAAGAIVVLALAAGLAATLVQAREARRQAGRADARAREAEAAVTEQRRLAASESAARTEAQDQRAAAEGAARSEKERADELAQVSLFQAAMLSQVDPAEAGARLTEDVVGRLEAAWTDLPGEERAGRLDAFRREWSAINATDAARALIDRTILRPASAAIDKQFKEQPLVDARLRQALADRYADLGLYDAALPLQTSAFETRRRELGAGHPDTLVSEKAYATLLQVRGRLDEAEPLFREALAARRRVLGEEHPDTLASISDLGALLDASGRISEAEPYYREALEKSRRVLGEEHQSTLRAISQYGTFLHDVGRAAEAEPYYREALEKRLRVFGEEHIDTLRSMDHLGRLLTWLGRYQEAEPYVFGALETRRRVMGEEHPETLDSLHSASNLCEEQGKLAEAEAYDREALEKRRRVLGPENPDTLVSLTHLSTVLRLRGQLDEAERCAREALEARRRVLGEDHYDTLTSLSELSLVLRAQRKYDEAEPYCREVLEKRRRLLGEDHPNTLNSISTLGTVLWHQGKLAESEPYCLEALEKRRSVLGEEHPDTLVSLNNVALLLRDQRRFAEAESYLREALEKSRRVLGEDHPEAITPLNNLALVLMDQGRLSEAEPYLREGLERCRRVLGDEHANTLTAMRSMGRLLQAQGKLAEAEACFREALEKTRRVRAEEHPDTLRAVDRLAEMLVAVGRLQEAEDLLLPSVALAEAKLKPGHQAWRDLVETLVALYAAWEKEAPGQGYGEKAASWKARLSAPPGSSSP